jgi:hypothetical protein
METEYGQRPLVALVLPLLLLLTVVAVSQTKQSKSSKVHTLPTHMEMESSVRVLLETLPHM